MQIRNLLLLVSRQFPLLQKRSEAFWQKAGNSYLAPSQAVYQAREMALREALEKIGRVRRAIDVGCGDGRFTLLLTKSAEQVEGYDISVPLIQEANSAAIREAGVNVEFHLAELEQFPTWPARDIVSCLGVTSCVLDDLKFGRVLDRLVKTLAVGGHLLLVDTLSDSKESTRAYRNGYVAKYRQREFYEHALSSRGMLLQERQRLADMGRDMSNYFYVFRHANES